MECRHRQLHLLRCDLRRKVDVDSEFTTFGFAADINETAFWKEAIISPNYVHANVFYSLSHVRANRHKRAATEAILSCGKCAVTS